MGGRSQGLWMDRQEESGSEDGWKGRVRVRGWTEGKIWGLRMGWREESGSEDGQEESGSEDGWKGGVRV